MARKKSSCLKKMVIGCGSFILIFVLLGFALFLSASLNKPKPADRQQLSVSESFGDNAENALNLPNNEVDRGKPVKLQIEVGMLNFDLIPHEASKEIEIESDYDVANFELDTKVEEKKDHIVYKIKFKNKRTILGMLLQGGIDSDDISNHVKVKVPKDLLIDLDFQMGMGDAELDLSGLAVANFSSQFSMGEFDVMAREPNQVTIKNFKLQASMGESKISDYQNLRIAKGRIEGSMGEVRIRNSGDLLEPSKLNLKMTMGEMRIDVPPSADLNANTSAVFGDSRETGRAEDVNGPRMDIDANVSFGNVRVNRNYSRSPLSGALLQIINEDGVEAAIAEYHTLKETRAKFFDFGPKALNNLGYRLLRRDQKEDAVAIFKLNVEVHPLYANGYDSLGEGYMKIGNREEAITNYKKSLELNPNNDNAHEMIAILTNEATAPLDSPEPPNTPEPGNNQSPDAPESTNEEGGN